MIHFLKGLVAEIAEDYVVLDVNGVGYKAWASARTLAQLREGEAIQLATHLHVREDQMTLFAFKDTAERRLFEVLTTVNGVGVKVGLALLSALSPEEIVGAIAGQDPTTLTRASGVGKKLAERLVLELKAKVGSLPVGTIGAGVGAVSGHVVSGGVAQDVLSALLNLGYKQPAARDAVAVAVKEAGTDPAFDVLFKKALAELRAN